MGSFGEPPVGQADILLMTSDKMTDEFSMELDTPEEGLQGMWVRPLGEGLFLSLAETDPFSRFYVLCGDKFEADELDDGTYKLRRIIEPFDVVHFEANLGLYLLDPRAQTREQKDEAFQRLGKMMDESYGTQALTDFFREHKGAWSLYEVIQHFTLFLHVPLAKRDLFFQQLPTLCPGLKEDDLKEILSGVNEEDVAP